MREVLVIELDLSLRHWVRQGGRLAEAAGGADGWLQLDSLPVRLRRRDGPGWSMEGQFGVTTLDQGRLGRVS